MAVTAMGLCPQMALFPLLLQASALWLTLLAVDFSFMCWFLSLGYTVLWIPTL